VKNWFELLCIYVHSRTYALITRTGRKLITKQLITPWSPECTCCANSHITHFTKATCLTSWNPSVTIACIEPQPRKHLASLQNFITKIK